jgi:hypothetical protein
MVKVDEEVDRGEKVTDRNRIERQVYPVGRNPVEDLPRRVRAAEYPYEVARIVRVGRQDVGFVVRPFRPVPAAVPPAHRAGGHEAGALDL